MVLVLVAFVAANSVFCYCCVVGADGEGVGGTVMGGCIGVGSWRLLALLETRYMQCNRRHKNAWHALEHRHLIRVAPPPSYRSNDQHNYR